MFKLQRRIRPESERQDQEPDRSGWNLIGMVDHRGGIGNAARANIDALRDITGNHRSIAFPSARYGNPGEVPAIHGHNYLHFNPSCVAIKHLDCLPWFADAVNVGYWAWETTMPPSPWLTYDPHMAQIWVPTEFVKTALLRSKFTAPIHVIPHAIVLRPQHSFPKANEPITFVVQFDGQSRFQRKRPDLSLAAINAAALKAGENIRILVKSHNKGTSQIAIASYPNIQVKIVDQWLEETQMQALFDTADILVSLNRGEGFGLPIMEAMARGCPAVATFWGGSLDYLTVENSYPVNVKKIEDAILADDAYFKTGQWAMPDVKHATHQIMRCMADIRSGAIFKITNQARLTAARFSKENMVRKMRNAIASL